MILTIGGVASNGATIAVDAPVAVTPARELTGRDTTAGCRRMQSRGGGAARLRIAVDASQTWRSSTMKPSGEVRSANAPSRP